MNVLLTSVGRRSYLVDFFKNAVLPDGRVIAVNSDPLTSGMVVADCAYISPRVDSDEYIPFILDLCIKEKVGLVVSLFDIDLTYLSSFHDKFREAGIHLVVSDPWVIETANDKWKTSKFFEKNNILTPKTFLNIEDVYCALNLGVINYPLIIKPRWGMGSLSVFRADNKDELTFFYHYATSKIKESYLNILSQSDIESSVIVQEFISGKEYGLDVFNDLDGEHIQTVCKHKISMRSGETDVAEIVDNVKLRYIGHKLACLFKHRGNIDVDILEADNGNFYVLEFNARFGGGYPFSHLAGANFPEALIEMASNKCPKKYTVELGCIGMKDINVIKSPSI